MKFTVFVDQNREEEVIVYCKEKTTLIEQIKNLVANEEFMFLGYDRGEIVKLENMEICCFSVIDNRVYAICDNGKYLIKERLYKIEERLTGDFIKINQSCIANVKKISKFTVSVGGTLKVVFKNGYTDYVSRRNLKIVKERIGI